MLLPLMTLDKYCWSWERIYLKANGRVPCCCDSGEIHTIIHKDLGQVDFVPDVLNSLEMREMRLSFLERNQQYIKQCQDCCCYQQQNKPKNSRYLDSEIATDIEKKVLHAQFRMKQVTLSRRWVYGSIDRISEMQVEPSFPCNLKCPGCLHGKHQDPLSTEAPPYILPLEWFVKIIESIQSHAVRLERIAFVGRGEPTMNKNLPQFIQTALSNIPGIVMSMDTNATHQFKDDYLSLTWINCSIDGSTSDSYLKYRRNGDFQKTIEFMRKAAKRKKELRKQCTIRWKYILFSTNDSELLLDHAQTLANELQIDELDFVITACGAADGSVTPSNILRTLTDVKDYLKRKPIFPHCVVSRS